MSSRIVILALGVGLLLVACEPEPPKKLTKTEKYTVDTTFNKMKDSLYKEMDKKCELIFDSLFQVAVDSIKTNRLEEIQALLGK